MSKYRSELKKGNNLFKSCVKDDGPNIIIRW